MESSYEEKKQLIAQRIERWHSLYKRTGSCKRCGYCCEYDAQFIYRGIYHKCGFLRYDTDGKASCLIYNYKPELCQGYPYVPNPLNPNCGYKFEWIGDKNGVE